MTPLGRKYGVLPLRLARVKYGAIYFWSVKSLAFLDLEAHGVSQPPFLNFFKNMHFCARDEHPTVFHCLSR